MMALCFARRKTRQTQRGAAQRVAVTLNEYARLTRTSAHNVSQATLTWREPMSQAVAMATNTAAVSVNKDAYASR